MQVDRKQALTMEFGSETYYFCSAHCLHTFEVNPKQQLGQRPQYDHIHAGDSG